MGGIGQRVAEPQDHIFPILPIIGLGTASLLCLGHSRFTSCAAWVFPEYAKSICLNALWLHAYNTEFKVLDVNKAKAE